MKHFEIEINVKTTGASDHKATLTAYIPDICEAAEMNEGMPAVMITPGGGYGHLSLRESEPVALKFASEGIASFVLKYSVAPAVFPQALCEAAMGIKIIRENATEWHINPHKITLCGFSAGGHLAGCLATFWNKEWLLSELDLPAEMIKPDLLVLSYPVITSGEFTHQGTIDSLLGNNKNEKMLALISLEKQVSKDVPPTFIWHTYEDGSVPVKNTMLFANALLDEGVPVEMHIYRKGSHGLSLGNFLVNKGVEYGRDLMISDWIEKAIRFIYKEEA